MLIIGGTIRLDPAKREEAIAAASEMMDATRKEPGCISYAMSADVQDSGVFHVFEEWESQEALDQHFQAPHMAKFQASAGGLGIQGMEIQRYEIASKGPLR